MKNTLKYLLIPLLLIIGLLIKSNAQSGQLTVRVAGVETNNGQVIVKLFNSAEGFPRDDEKAFRVTKQKVTGDTCTVVVTGLPYGDYAIVAIHDINSNDELDKNWVGFPDEPIGMSNYKKIGRPDFDKAKVTISGHEQKEIVVTVQMP